MCGRIRLRVGLTEDPEAEAIIQFRGIVRIGSWYAERWCQDRCVSGVEQGFIQSISGHLVQSLDPKKAYRMRWRRYMRSHYPQQVPIERWWVDRRLRRRRSWRHECLQLSYLSIPSSSTTAWSKWLQKLRLQVQSIKLSEVSFVCAFLQETDRRSWQWPVAVVRHHAWYSRMEFASLTLNLRLGRLVRVFYSIGHVVRRNKRSKVLSRSVGNWPDGLCCCCSTLLHRGLAVHKIFSFLSKWQLRRVTANLRARNTWRCWSHFLIWPSPAVAR